MLWVGSLCSPPCPLATSRSRYAHIPAGGPRGGFGPLFVRPSRLGGYGYRKEESDRTTRLYRNLSLKNPNLYYIFFILPLYYNKIGVFGIISTFIIFYYFVGGFIMDFIMKITIDTHIMIIKSTIHKFLSPSVAFVRFSVHYVPAHVTFSPTYVLRLIHIRLTARSGRVNEVSTERSDPEVNETRGQQNQGSKIDRLGWILGVLVIPHTVPFRFTVVSVPFAHSLRSSHSLHLTPSEATGTEWEGAE